MSDVSSEAMLQWCASRGDGCQPVSAAERTAWQTTALSVPVHNVSQAVLAGPLKVDRHVGKLVGLRVRVLRARVQHKCQ